MKILTLIIGLLLSGNLFGQYGNSYHLYTRTRPAESSIGFEKNIYDNFAIAVELGYRFRFVDQAYVPYGFFGYPFQAYKKNRAYRGISVRPIVLNFNPTEETTHSLSLAYRFLSADDIIYDPGKFGGSNTSDYARYSEEKHVVGISYLMHQRLEWLPQLSFYFEIGPDLNFYKRQYSVEGTFSGQFPSNKVESGAYVSINANLGIKIDLKRIW